MTTLKTRTNPSRRIEWGTMILVAARGLDITPIKDRFAAFAKAHETYVAAQAKVDQLEERLWTAQQNIAALDLTQDARVQALAGALIVDGHPYKQPLGRFSQLTPGKLIRLSHGDEAEEIHRVVDAIKRDKSVSKATLQVAEAADVAATAVDQALSATGKLEQGVNQARHARDVAGQPWETAFAGLVLAAKNADHDGGTRLHATLFASINVVKGKKRKTSTAATTPPPAGPTVEPAASEHPPTASA